MHESLGFLLFHTIWTSEIQIQVRWDHNNKVITPTDAKTRRWNFNPPRKAVTHIASSPTHNVHCIIHDEDDIQSWTQIPETPQNSHYNLPPNATTPTTPPKKNPPPTQHPNTPKTNKKFRVSGKHNIRAETQEKSITHRLHHHPRHHHHHQFGDAKPPKLRKYWRWRKLTPKPGALTLPHLFLSLEQLVCQLCAGTWCSLNRVSTRNRIVVIPRCVLGRAGAGQADWYWWWRWWWRRELLHFLISDTNPSLLT